jgi:hypothetical protein
MYEREQKERTWADFLAKFIEQFIPQWVVEKKKKNFPI